MTERLVSLMIGYFLGIIQTSYLIGKTKGIDIRKHGSGNAGTTNAIRIMGKKIGVITFLCDCFKCIIAVILVHFLFKESFPTYIRLLRLYAATGAILGHNFPFYLKFKGGKGIACTAGLLASYYLPLGLAALFVFVLIFGITNYVSLGSLAINIVFLVGTIIMGVTGVMDMPSNYVMEMYMLAAFICVMAFWRHRANIGRLLAGTENKTYLGKRKK